MLAWFCRRVGQSVGWSAVGWSVWLRACLSVCLSIRPSVHLCLRRRLHLRLHLRLLRCRLRLRLRVRLRLRLGLRRRVRLLLSSSSFSVVFFLCVFWSGPFCPCGVSKVVSRPIVCVRVCFLLASSSNVSLLVCWLAGRLAGCLGGGLLV